MIEKVETLCRDSEKITKKSSLNFLIKEFEQTLKKTEQELKKEKKSL